MSPETEIIQFWSVIESGKCVYSAAGVVNGDMNGSRSSQWAMKTIQFSEIEI